MPSAFPGGTAACVQRRNVGKQGDATDSHARTGNTHLRPIASARRVHPLQQGLSDFILPPQVGEWMLAERGP